MTVEELLARISSRELTEWQAYFLVDAEDRRKREMVEDAISGAQSRRWSR
jgi:hypothetical protein